MGKWWRKRGRKRSNEIKEEWYEVFKDRLRGMSYRKLGEKYGMSYEWVRLICKRMKRELEKRLGIKIDLEPGKRIIGLEELIEELRK